MTTILQTLRLREKLAMWLVIAVLLGLFVFLIKGILLPFVVAAIIAYFLDPAADRLELWGVSRSLATFILCFSFFLIVVTLVALLMPIFSDQFLAFIHKMPEYSMYIETRWMPKVYDVIEHLDPGAVEKGKEILGDASSSILRYVAQMMGDLWNSGLAVVNVLSLLFITPVVAFYLLKDWDKFIEHINHLLPLEYAETIRQQCKEIDKTISAYIRGQTNVCLFLAVFYGIGLTAVGLQFGLFIGMATGILTFIPYVGLLFGFVVGMIVGGFQFWGDWTHLGMVVAVFAVGQIVEGNIVTPRLVGKKVGLHPLWIVFGLLSGGAIFGFIGILIAVPVTAVIGVLIRFSVDRYRHSVLYLGKRVVVCEETMESF
ncbi:MAG: AI-2E family transporter [Alphaproteobacteria bacterium]|nr:AI-2E family transporter [Alphaproteobacteria bacterium]